MTYFDVRLWFKAGQANADPTSYLFVLTRAAIKGIDDSWLVKCHGQKCADDSIMVDGERYFISPNWLSVDKPSELTSEDIEEMYAWAEEYTTYLVDEIKGARRYGA